jgi:hypothetical protein
MRVHLRNRFAGLLFAGLLVALVPAAAAAQAPGAIPDIDIAAKTAEAILRMPYYGVFDLITERVENGVVTLGGYVYQAINKSQAENAIKEISGIQKVVNDIEILPTSLEDDRLRWDVFHKIYTDDFLSKYGTPITGAGGMRGRRFFDGGGSAWWGRGYRPTGAFGARWASSPFMGGEPLGNYAIHIIVKGGQVMLFGRVNNEVDRTRADQVARGVFGVRGVDNQIQVSTDR